MTSAPIPTDAEIRARAEELQLVAPGADLPHDVRRKVAAALHAERRAPKPPPVLEAQLLSRSTHDVPGGTLRIDVVFIPNTETKETPQHGNTD